MVRVQVVVPVQSPPQPVNFVYPAAVAGVAVSVTEVPLVYVALHVPGQLMPAGLLVTVPPPWGDTVTERVMACFWDITGVLMVAVLFPVLGSPVALEVVAVLLRVVPAADPGTFTTSVKLAVALAAKLAVLQWTFPVLPTAGVVQFQPAGTESDWKVVAVGMVSSSTAVVAALGPLLVTVRV